MTDKPGSSSRFLFLIAGLGVASSLLVTFALRVFSQREGSDPFFASDAYLQVQQTVAIRTIRKAMAEEFVDTVVECISPQSLQSQILTEQQVTERVMTVLENFSASNNSSKNQKCENSKSMLGHSLYLADQLSIGRRPGWVGP
jgi:hypothetical protein